MAENTDLRLTAEAWAEIVISKWRQKLTALRIEQTGNLFKSFYFHVHNNADGNPALILFTFEKYGMYVDYGVGREVAKGNSGNLSQYAKYSEKTRSMHLGRERKEWFSGVYYRELNRLREIVADKYGKKAAQEIMFGINLLDNRYTVNRDKAPVIKDFKSRSYQ